MDDVKQSDIQVIEDGVPQTIESFSLVERPVIYGLVIDTSGSMRSQFSTIIDTAKKIIEAKIFAIGLTEALDRTEGLIRRSSRDRAFR